jgi:hypothetical protein
MPCAKRASSSSIPSRGMNAWPAQKKKIHKIHANAALRSESGWGFTAGVDRTETEMVTNVRQRGPEWEQENDLAFGTAIASDSSRAGVEMGNGSKDSSNESDGALKPLADFAVYTFAMAEDAKEKK